MKNLAALVAACLVSSACWAETPQQRFDQLAAQAQALADKGSFAEAAAALNDLDTDTALIGETGWPAAQYARARYLAWAGQRDAALALLETATRSGLDLKASELAADKDFAALCDLPRFKQVLAVLERQERLWTDNPAIATPYRPTLTEDEKIAGLSKLWSEARFNFPFFARVPNLDWDATYRAFLPQVRAAKSTEDYYRVLMRFLETLKDGHTAVRPPAELMDSFYGVTDVETRLIEDRIVVTAVTDPALQARGIRRGAEIMAIDGMPARQYADTKVAPYVFGYTPQDRAIWQYGYQLLRGPVGKPVHLTLKDDGKTISVAVPRIHNTGLFGYLPKFPASAEFKMLPGGIAYLEVTEFMDDAGVKAVRAHAAEIAAAKGFIIDIRRNGGGSTGNGRDIIKILADKPFTGGTMRAVDYKAAHRSWSRPASWYRAASPQFQPDPSLHIATPVVVLIGPRTYSAAEDFLVAFIGTGRGTLVGESSGGSTGNSVTISLPGGGRATICAIDDTFPNGRVFEGVGIAPDIEVKPTIADIRQGRDPVVEKAIAIFQSSS